MSAFVVESTTDAKGVARVELSLSRPHEHVRLRVEVLSVEARADSIDYVRSPGPIPTAPIVSSTEWQARLDRFFGSAETAPLHVDYEGDLDEPDVAT